MLQQTRELLADIYLFDGLPDACLDELARNSRVHRFPAGTMLFNQDEPADFLYIALEGNFELFETASDGTETVVEISTAPKVYTMAAVLTDSPSIVSGRVLQQARVLMIDADALASCVASYPRLGQNLIVALAWQYRTMVRQVINLKAKSAAQRLGLYILDFAKTGEPGQEVELPGKKRQLASRLGMTTVSLSRAYRTLREHGVELRRNNTVHITDPARLQSFCNPDNLINESERELRFRGR